MDDHQVIGADAEFLYQQFQRLAAPVHKGLRPGQDDPLPGNLAGAGPGEGLETIAPRVVLVDQLQVVGAAFADHLAAGAVLDVTALQLVLRADHLPQPG